MKTISWKQGSTMSRVIGFVLGNQYRFHPLHQIASIFHFGLLLQNFSVEPSRQLHLILSIKLRKLFRFAFFILFVFRPAAFLFLCIFPPFHRQTVTRLVTRQEVEFGTDALFSTFFQRAVLFNSFYSAKNQSSDSAITEPSPLDFRRSYDDDVKCFSAVSFVFSKREGLRREMERASF